MIALLKFAIVLSFSIGLISDLSGEDDSKPNETGKMLLTIFLKHDQSKTLDEINSHLERTEFWKHFPPDGVEIVSWYVMMGAGQVVTLKLSPDQLREVNLLIEKKAWGAFKTEFYPTYDYQPVWQSKKSASPATKKP